MKRYSSDGSVSTEAVLYTLCVAILVYPIWANAYFLTLDGPMHLANARLLLAYLQPLTSSLLNDYLIPNFSLFPYWFGHIALALLQTVFSAEVAQKLFLTAYIVLFAMLLRRAVRQINPDASFLSFIGLLLICHKPFQMGFLSFSFSLVFLLAIILHWVIHPGTLTPERLLVRTLLFLLLYFAHPTTYVAAVVIIGALSIWSWVYSCFAAGRALGDGLGDLGPVVSSFVVSIAPSTLLLVSYVLVAPSYQTSASETYRELIGNVLQQTNLTLLRQDEAWLGIAVMAGFGLLCLLAAVQRIRAGRWQLADGFLLGALLALGMHLYASSNFIGFFERLQMLPLLLLLFWLSAGSWGNASRLAVRGVVPVVLIGLLLMRAPVYAQASDNAEELVSMLPHLEPGSTVLPINYAPYGCREDREIITDVIYLFLHTTDYLGATEKPILMLDNIGPLYPMFPFRWRGDRDPYRFLPTNEGLNHQPPSVDFASYPRRTGGYVDYVLLWCLDPRLTGHPYVADVQRQLVQGYDLIATSEQGRAQLYRARPASLSGQVKSRDPQGAKPPVETDLALSNQYLQQSLDLYNADNFAECIAAATKAAVYNPKSDRAYNNICAAHNALGEWDRAIVACQHALRLNPDSMLARNNLQVALQALQVKPFQHAPSQIDVTPQ